MNKAGGRGTCEFCNEWHNNVSYHTAQDCLANPNSYAIRSLTKDPTRDIVSDYIESRDPMGLHFNCDKCKEELKQAGALIFSPPYQNNITKKYHLCRSCYNLLTRCFLNIDPLSVC